LVLPKRVLRSTAPKKKKEEEVAVEGIAILVDKL
jgi:hypothetical protein